MVMADELASGEKKRRSCQGQIKEVAKHLHKIRDEEKAVKELVDELQKTKAAIGG